MGTLPLVQDISCTSLIGVSHSSVVIRSVGADVLVVALMSLRAASMSESLLSSTFSGRSHDCPVTGSLYIFPGSSLSA